MSSEEFLRAVNRRAVKKMVRKGGVIRVKIEVTDSDLENAFDVCLRLGSAEKFSKDQKGACQDLIAVAALWSMLGQSVLLSSDQFELLCEQGCENSVCDAAMARFGLTERPDAEVARESFV